MQSRGELVGIDRAGLVGIARALCPISVQCVSGKGKGGEGARGREMIANRAEGAYLSRWMKLTGRFSGSSTSMAIASPPSRWCSFRYWSSSVSL